MLEKIKDIDVTYELMSHEETYEYRLTGNITHAPDKDSIRFMLRKIVSEDETRDFSCVIFREDNCYYIKSDYFEDPAYPYKLEAKEDSDGIEFVSEDETERMTIYASTV